MNDNEYLNTEQAAVHLNMRPKTLARYRVAGGGPVYHLLGRLVRYLREDLDKWARDRRRASTSDDGSALPAPDTPGSPVPRSRVGAGGARGQAQPGSGDPGTGAAQ